LLIKFKLLKIKIRIIQTQTVKGHTLYKSKKKYTEKLNLKHEIYFQVIYVVVRVAYFQVVHSFVNDVSYVLTRHEAVALLTNILCFYNTS